MWKGGLISQLTANVWNIKLWAPASGTFVCLFRKHFDFNKGRLFVNCVLTVSYTTKQTYSSVWLVFPKVTDFVKVEMKNVVGFNLLSFSQLVSLKIPMQYSQNVQNFNQKTSMPWWAVVRQQSKWSSNYWAHIIIPCHLKNFFC